MSDQDYENLMNHPKLHYMTDMSDSDVAKLRANRKLAKQLGCIPVTVKDPGVRFVIHFVLLICSNTCYLLGFFVALLIFTAQHVCARGFSK